MCAGDRLIAEGVRDGNVIRPGREPPGMSSRGESGGLTESRIAKPTW